MIKTEPRIYGAWAGRPNGTPEDKRCCIFEVWPNERGPIPYQCNRKRGHGPEGLYCGQHDPAEVARREKARTAKYKAESSRRLQGWAAIEALRGIKDPRAFMAHARKVLGPEEMKKWEGK